MADVTRWEVKYDPSDGAGYFYPVPPTTDWFTADAEVVLYTDHLAELERVRVETLREASNQINHILDQRLTRSGMDVGLNMSIQTAVSEEFTRLINAATTGDTDD